MRRGSGCPRIRQQRQRGVRACRQEESSKEPRQNCIVGCSHPSTEVQLQYFSMVLFASLRFTAFFCHIVLIHGDPGILSQPGPILWDRQGPGLEASRRIENQRLPCLSAMRLIVGGEHLGGVELHWPESTPFRHWLPNEQPRAPIEDSAPK